MGNGVEGVDWTRLGRGIGEEERRRGGEEERREEGGEEERGERREEEKKSHVSCALHDADTNTANALHTS